MKKIGIVLPLFALVFLAGCTNTTPEIVQEVPVVEVATGVVEETAAPEPMEAKIAPTTDLLSFVAAHSGADSCYTVISGSVYDMTSRIGKHPGGDKAILASCGKDSTAMFDGKHGMDPKKWEGLKQFEIKM